MGGNEGEPAKMKIKIPRDQARDKLWMIFKVGDDKWASECGRRWTTGGREGWVGNW